MDMPLLYCKNCNHHYLPPKSFCPQCFNNHLEETFIKGTGKIFSYTTIHIAPERLAAQAPYHIILVQMDEGPRVTGRLVEGEPVIDQKVELDAVEDGVYWFK